MVPKRRFSGRRKVPKHDKCTPESPPQAPPEACPPQAFAGEVTFFGPFGGTKLAASRVSGQLAPHTRRPRAGGSLPSASAAVPGVGHSVALTSQCQPGPPAG